MSPLQPPEVLADRYHLGELIGRGAFGDGKVFVSPVDEAFTISTGAAESMEQQAEPAVACGA